MKDYTYMVTERFPKKVLLYSISPMYLGIKVGRDLHHEILTCTRDVREEVPKVNQQGLMRLFGK